MSMWSPWRGCHKYSTGCMHCYIHKGDSKRNIDTNEIVKLKDFDKPIQKLKNGNYKMKAGLCYVCFSTDFLIEEADKWRNDCWQMMKKREDVTFLFLTKRIERLASCLPDDWGDGYSNVVIFCTIEDQQTANIRLPIFTSLPIKHRCITAQPLIENIDIEQYLDNIELVVVGGESDFNARTLDYSWVLNIRNQCIKKNCDFEFRQAGTHFFDNNQMYYLKTRDLTKIAREKEININDNKDRNNRIY